MKRHIIAALTAGMLLLTGCAGTAAKSEQEPTETTQVVYLALPLPNLFVNIPESYEETSSEFYEKYYIRDDASIIVTEDNESPNTDIKDYSTRALLQYQQVAESVDVIGSDLVYAGSLAVQTLEFTYTLDADSAPLTTMVGFASDNRTVYIVTCKCAAEHYEQNRADFLGVMQSIRIDKTSQNKNTAPPLTETEAT